MHQILVHGQLLDVNRGSFQDEGRTVDYFNVRVYDADEQKIIKANNPNGVALPAPMVPSIFVFDVNAGEKYCKLVLADVRDVPKPAKD